MAAESASGRDATTRGWDGNGGKRVLALSSSPRRGGNSRRFAGALREGTAGSGHPVRRVHLPDHLHGMLRDWRECRGDDGQCPIDDGYNALFLDLFLPADAIVYATALWWYGMSGHLETFMDRILCCISESYPDAEEVTARLPGKRAALVLGAEESDFGARRAVTQHMQEYCRYLHHDPSGIVTGNERGEVGDDAAGPVEAARELGRRLFDIHTTEYCLDTERPGGVWGGDARSFPAFWR